MEKDEVLLVVSTEKVNAEVPAPVAGQLKQILVAEGETIPVGTTVATIETALAETEAVQERPPAAPPELTKVEAETTPTEPRAAAESPSAATPVVEPESATKQVAPGPKADITEAEPSEDREMRKQEEGGPISVSPRPRVSPLARTIAEKEGIPLEELEHKPGSGPAGRVMKRDVLADLEMKKKAPPSPPGVRAGLRPVPTETRRGAEAEEISQAVRVPYRVPAIQAVPYANSMVEVDMTDLIQYLEKAKETFERQEGIELTLMPFILIAAINALKRFPVLNASIEEDTVTLKESINLGLTVPLEKGVVTPVIKRADSLNLLGMARAIHDLANRAEARELEPEELQGGTFTVSNSGTFGAVVDAPVVHPQQAATLGIGAIKKRLVVVRDMIAIRSIMYAALSYDYRIISGSVAARFLQAFAHILETADFGFLKT